MLQLKNKNLPSNQLFYDSPHDIFLLAFCALQLKTKGH